MTIILVRLKKHLMDLKVGIEKADGVVKAEAQQQLLPSHDVTGRPGFGGKLHVHIVSRVVCIIVTHGILSRIADIRHDEWNKTNSNS
jgi:hypothetical protein